MKTGPRTLNTDEAEPNFEDRLARVRERIAAACDRSGRRVEEVNLLPVTKKKPPEVVAQAVEAGLVVFGENRVQEAKQKIPACPGNLDWHMIGHLQRNKARDAVNLFSMIHSVDSARLIRALEESCDVMGGTIRVCLEVNVAGDSAKYGLSEDNVADVLEVCMDSSRVEVVGLMTMPPFSPEPEDSRPSFKRLRTLRDELNDSIGAGLSELSMGMSGDFEVAIEEGATWIRLGTVLFGNRSVG